jgi:hypothetical protein
MRKAIRPTCNYVSHDYLDACRSCGGDLSAFKAQIGLRVPLPGVGLDLSEAAADRIRPTAPEIAMATPGADISAPDAMPSLEFVEIEDEPSSGTGP